MSLPSEIHCCVCGDKVKIQELNQKEATLTGALRSGKFLCSCGAAGVFSSRKTKEGYFMYSMTFYILPARAEKSNVINLKDWLRRPS